MPKESVCLKVPKVCGQKTLELVAKLGLVDKSLLIQRSVDELCVPILRAPGSDELKLLKTAVEGVAVSSGVFEEKRKPPPSLAEALADQLPPDLAASIPRALDVVGDIAIIDIPQELTPYKTLLGETILQTHHGVHVVLAKAGKVSGVFRLREFEFLAGEQRTTTVHREYGCVLRVDVAKTYFSPRLSHEHERVAKLVGADEVVVDLFAGVGPFAVPIARNQKTAKVYAIDLNPQAVELLKQNVRLNRVDSQVYPVVGDARQVVEEWLAGIADRVIMNLPETAYEFVDVACRAIKPSGGVVHFYGFVRQPDSLESFGQRFCAAVEAAGRRVAGLDCVKTVRETAPFEWQVVLDAHIS